MFLILNKENTLQINVLTIFKYFIINYNNL